MKLTLIIEDDKDEDDDEDVDEDDDVFFCEGNRSSSGAPTCPHYLKPAPQHRRKQLCNNVVNLRNNG